MENNIKLENEVPIIIIKFMINVLQLLEKKKELLLLYRPLHFYRLCSSHRYS